MGWKYVISASLLILTVLTCVLYAQRDQLLVHYHVQAYVENEEASSKERHWLRQRSTLVLPVLLSYLSEKNEKVCRRAGGLVGEIISEHPDPTNPTHSHLLLSSAANLHQQYPRFSKPGRSEALSISFEILEKHLGEWSPNVPTALETAGVVLLLGLEDEDPLVQEFTLRKMNRIWKWNGSDDIARSLVEEWKRECYTRADKLLSSPSPTLRSWAARAIAGAPYHEADPDLFGLLGDAQGEVRKAVLLALAETGDRSLSSDQKMAVINFLHDEDPLVAGASEKVLRSSGMGNTVLRLAQLIKHPVPAERAKVVSMVFGIPEIDPLPWIFTLVKDPSPAVRVAAARAASTSGHPELIRKLKEMAQSDPDRGVRELSQQFLIQLAGKKTLSPR